MPGAEARGLRRDRERGLRALVHCCLHPRQQVGHFAHRRGPPRRGGKTKSPSLTPMQHHDMAHTCARARRLPAATVRGRDPVRHQCSTGRAPGPLFGSRCSGVSADGGFTRSVFPGPFRERSRRPSQTGGPNTLPQTDRRTFIRIILEILREPMFALLLGAALIYLVLGDLKEAIVLGIFACTSCPSSEFLGQRTG